MLIENNVCDLTEEEKKLILGSENYVYGYKTSGLIMLVHDKIDYLAWDCSDSVGAKDYLDQLEIKEAK